MVRPKPLSPSQIITTPGAKLSKIVIAVLSKSVIVPLSHNKSFMDLDVFINIGLVVGFAVMLFSFIRMYW